MEINQKGQAAVTDALFFLMIIISLSVFLYNFANSYGSTVQEQIQNEFQTTFATNSLKTILYTSTSRDPTETIYDPDAEIDYLLALIKEDYADDEKINDREKLVLSNTVSSILAPLADSTDYIFYITVPENKKIVFMFLHLTNFTKTDPGLPGQGFYIYGADPSETHKDYFCGLDNETIGGSTINSDYETVVIKLTRLLANVGPTSSATSAAKLIKIGSDGSFGDFKAQVDLIMWDATWLGETRDRPALLDVSAPHSDWGCVEVSAVTP